jgi:hypothetical protein
MATFSEKDSVTKISPDGLRYESKVNGSQFKGMGFMGETMSCLKCARHKSRKSGVMKKFGQQKMFVCFDCFPSQTDSNE